MKPDNKTWSERFDKEFEIAREQNDNWNIWESDVIDFIRQELATQKKQITKKLSEKFHNRFEEGFADKYGYYDNENEWHEDYDRYFDDIIKSLEQTQ